MKLIKLTEESLSKIKKAVYTYADKVNESHADADDSINQVLKGDADENQAYFVFEAIENYLPETVSTDKEIKRVFKRACRLIGEPRGGDCECHIYGFCHNCGMSDY